MTKRILVIANKWFEVDPLVAVLANSQARPSAITNLEYVFSSQEVPAAPPEAPNPRQRFQVAGYMVEVWCIQDLMNGAKAGGYSNTQEKARVLPEVFSYEAELPALVVAFGTAASMPDGLIMNGSVRIGSAVFLHDPFASDSTLPESPSHWNDPGKLDKVINSTLPATFFDALTPTLIGPLNAKLLPPATRYNALAVDIDPAGVAVSTVNVTDTSLFPKTDPQSLEAAQKAGIETIASFESTHGLIRVQSEAPFLFVSGITNRMGHFADEVQPYLYAENFVASHNAGIALAGLLPLAAKILAG